MQVASHFSWDIFKGRPTESDNQILECLFVRESKLQIVVAWHVCACGILSRTSLLTYMCFLFQRWSRNKLQLMETIVHHLGSRITFSITPSFVGFVSICPVYSAKSGPVSSLLGIADELQRPGKLEPQCYVEPVAPSKQQEGRVSCTHGSWIRTKHFGHLKCRMLSLCWCIQHFKIWKSSLFFFTDTQRLRCH